MQSNPSRVWICIAASWVAAVSKGLNYTRLGPVHQLKFVLEWIVPVFVSFTTAGKGQVHLSSAFLWIKNTTWIHIKVAVLASDESRVVCCYISAVRMFISYHWQRFAISQHSFQSGWQLELGSVCFRKICFLSTRDGDFWEKGSRKEEE